MRGGKGPGAGNPERQPPCDPRFRRVSMPMAPWISGSAAGAYAIYALAYRGFLLPSVLSLLGPAAGYPVLLGVLVLVALRVPR